MAAISTITVLFKGVNQVTPAATAAAASVSKVGSSATGATGALSKLGGAGALLKGTLVTSAVLAAGAIVKMGMESEAVNAQTTAALQSTASAANVTLTEIQALAGGIQDYSGISDEAVQTGSNMLLTFTNIQNGVGEANQIFDQANVALADMATRMSGGVTPSAESMSSSAIKLGKALNDPLAGMTALSRVGVQFTADQKAMITTMVQAGDTMGAQKVILGELTTEFGGSAKAMGDTFSGQFNIMKETVFNILETIVVGIFNVAKPIISALIPAFKLIGTVVGGVVKVVSAAFSLLSGGWTKMSGAMKATLVVLAPLWLPIVGAVLLVKVGVQALVGVFNAVKNAVVSFAKGAAQLWNDFLAGLGPVGDALKAVGDTLVNVIPDTIKADADAAAASMRTVGLTTVLAAQQGSAAIVQMGQNLAVVRQHMQETGQSAEWTKQFQAGLTAVDNALKSGTLSAADAQKAYMAWGMSLSAAQQRTAGLTSAMQKLGGSTKPAVDAAAAMGNAWANVGPKAASSINKIATAINKSINSAVKLARNTQTVTQRLVDDYGLTAEGAAKFLEGASSKSIQKMATTGGKGFAKIGGAAQKFNKYLPESEKGTGQLSAAAAKFAQSGDKMARSIDGGGKAAANGAKSQGKLSQEVEKGGKAASGGGKDFDKLAKAVDAGGKAASGAIGDMSKLGNTLKSQSGSVSTMATNVGKLKTELAGLKSVTITVTVNIKKTGELGLGGVVPGLARGGKTMMPLTMVGERGPELAALPTGTRVFSHSDTTGMLRSAMAEAQGGAGGPMQLSGKLVLINGEAYIEGVVQEVLNDGSSLDSALTSAIRRP